MTNQDKLKQRQLVFVGTLYGANVYTDSTNEEVIEDINNFLSPRTKSDTEIMQEVNNLTKQS